MADIIQNVQEVYKKWESKSRPRYNRTVGNKNNQGNFDRHSYHNNSFDGENGEASWCKGEYTQPGLRPRFQKRDKLKDKVPHFNLPRYHGIAQFKMAPLLVLSSKQRPFMGECCQKCFPQSRGAFDGSYEKSLGIKDVLQKPNENRNFILPKSLDQILFLLRRNSDYKYCDVTPAVLNNERVQLAVIKASHNEAEQLISSFNFESLPSTKEWHRVKKFLHRMKSHLSSLLLRISGWFLFVLLSRILNSINIHMGHIEMLTKVSKNETPIVYLPLHRSNLDYVLISFILHMYNLQSPLIAIGERLQYPFLGYLLKFLGAFHTSLSLQEQVKLNKSILHALQQSYIGESMKAGHNMEFFPEGSRSLSGKSCMPRSELISAVLESLVEGRIEDAYIVPIAISYEKIVDGNFIPEQLGKGHVLHSFVSIISYMWSMLHSKFGSVRVDFCQPFTLKEFLHSTKHANAFKAISSIETPPSSPNSRSTSLKLSAYEKAFTELGPIVEDLGQHAVYDATNSAALMSTQILAFLFLTKHRKGATQQQLLYSIDWLRKELERRKWDVGFTGESLAVLKHAVNLLGKDLIKSETISVEWASSDMENNNVTLVLYKPIVKLPYVLELQYYANAVLPVFLLESIVANALLALLDGEIELLHDCDSKLLVMRQELVDKAVELTDILQFEFLFAPPCQDIPSVINNVIEDLIAKECLEVCGAVIIGDKPINSYRQQSTYDFLSDEEDYIERDQQLKVSLTEESVGLLQFFRCVLSPYIESYWLAACALLKLVNEEREETEFFHEMQKTAQERLHKGLLAYEESFALETLRNALELFEQWKITEHYTYSSIKIIYLHEDFNFEESIAEVISRIEQFRK